MFATRGESTAPFIKIWTSFNQDLSWRNTIASHRDLENTYIELAKTVSYKLSTSLEFVVAS